MIALAAVALALCSQAATVNWILAGVTQPGKTDAASGYVAYLFASSVSSGLSETYSVVAQSDVISAIEGGTFGTFTSKAVATATTNASGGILSTGIGSFGAGDSLSLYAVVFDAATFGDAENYAATASDKTVSFTSSTGAKPASWSAFSTTAGQGWTAVPEPTSGLLMLLGMASLALKRKRT